MNRLSSPAYLRAKAYVPAVLAHGATPEQLVAAEMHLASLAPTPQRQLFSAPPTRELLPGDTPRLPVGGAEPFGVLENPL